MSSSDFKIERSLELLPETKEIAERELRETPERVREALERLRELLKENDDIYFSDEDEILTIFLRPCKWYPESALALMFAVQNKGSKCSFVFDMNVTWPVLSVHSTKWHSHPDKDCCHPVAGFDKDYYMQHSSVAMRRVAEFKRDYASLLQGLRPEHEKDGFLHHRIANVLKGRDHKGRRVLIVSCGSTWDPKKISADQMFRLFYLIHLAALLETETQVRGAVVIMDFHNMGWSQIMGLSPAVSKRLLTFIQDAMPSRLKEVHVVKQPMIFNVVWNMFKPFIREKLKSRMFFHGTKMSSLHKYMAPSHLPADYGGQLPAIDYSSADWYPAIFDAVPHIENWDNFGFVKK